MEAGRLQVRRTLSLTKDGHVFEQPKNGKGRSVELTQAASDTLRSHLTRQLQEIEASGDEYQDQGLTPHRRDRVPEASCHVATLCQSGDFYRYASGNLRAAFPTLPDRSQFNRLVRFYSELIEEALALHLAEVSEARERPYQALDSSALDVRPGRQA